MKINIYLMYMMRLLRSFLFSLAVTFLLFQSKWLGTTELFIIQSVFAISIVLFEIPTGFISDKYSRKISMIIWLALSAIWFFVYYASSGFWWFLFAEFVIAIWCCCISGTDTAIIYDSMKAEWREDEYKTVSGRYSLISSVSEWIWAIAWWFIWLYGLQIPFLMDGVFIVFAMIIALFLKEPPRDKLSHTEWSRKQIWDILKYIYNHKKLLRLMIFSGILWTITISMVRFTQPFMTYIKLPQQYFGVFLAITNILWWFFWLITYQTEKYLWESRFVYFVVIFAILCLIALWLAQNIWMLTVFLLFHFVRQGSRMISQDNLHILSDSSIRATVQSVNSMFFRLCFAVFGPIFWYISSVTSLWWSFMLIAIILWGLWLAAAYQLQKQK